MSPDGAEGRALLEPLAALDISPGFLSEDERIQIADLASRRHGPATYGGPLRRSAASCAVI